MQLLIKYDRIREGKTSLIFLQGVLLMTDNEYFSGLKDGVSIGLGYFSVSFSFGILAIKGHLGVFSALLISMTNLTSAGQFAGLANIIAGSGIITVALTQLIINLRYALMSLALSQKLEPDTSIFKRCIIAFFNTDEIFAVAMGRDKNVNLKYMLGLGTIPWFGWSMGTLVGAIAGEILPISVTNALGLALYAMFIAIVVPSFKTSKSVKLVVFIAAFLSCVVNLFDVLKDFSIIICTVLSAGFVAWKFPVEVAGGKLKK